MSLLRIKSEARREKNDFWKNPKKHMARAGSISSGETSSGDVSPGCSWESEHRVYSSDANASLTTVGYIGKGSVGSVDEVETTLPMTSVYKTLIRKRIVLPWSGRQARRAEIQREVQTLRSLSHAHIVRLVGTYEDGPPDRGTVHYCLLMSPVGDEDLKMALEIWSSRIPELRSEFTTHGMEDTSPLLCIARWFACLASALAYIHDQRVRHEDIKPSNIVRRGSQILLTDFGSARRFQPEAATWTLSPAQYTQMYGAPEMFPTASGDFLQAHGRAADIFSLGCVFLEMLTVLSLRSVQDFQDFCRVRTASSRPQQYPQPFLYCQSLVHVDQWFDPSAYESITEMPLDQQPISFEPIFREIQLMISEDKNLRPSAKDVHNQAILWKWTWYTMSKDWVPPSARGLKSGSLYCSCDDQQYNE